MQLNNFFNDWIILKVNSGGIQHAKVISRYVHSGAVSDKIFRLRKMSFTRVTDIYLQMFHYSQLKGVQWVIKQQNFVGISLSASIL